MPVGSTLTALAGASTRSAGTPGWPHAAPPRLWHCLVLAALLHALLVALIGTAPGGTAAPGQGVWGRINVVLDIGLRGPGERPGVGESAPPRGPSTEGPRGPARTERVGGAVRPPPVQPLPDQPGAQREGRWQPTESPPRAAADSPKSAPAEPTAIAEPTDQGATPGAAAPPVPDVAVPVPPPAARTVPAVQLESADLPPAMPAVRPPLPEPAAVAQPTPRASPIVPLPAPARRVPAPVRLAPNDAAPASAGPVMPSAPPIAQPEPPPVALPTPARRSPAPVRLSDADAPPALATARPAPPEPPPVALPAPPPVTLPAPPRRAVAPVELAPVDRALPPATEAAAVTLPTVVAAPEAPPTATAATPAPTAPAAAAAVADAADAERPSKPMPSAGATAGTPGPALQAPGSPQAGARVGHDVATPPSVPPSAPPRLNLDYMRPSGGALAAQPRRGALALMPAPPERKSKLAEGIEQAAKPDCRTAYAGAGLAAVVPLAMDAARGKGCKW